MLDTKKNTNALQYVDSFIDSLQMLYKFFYDKHLLNNEGQNNLHPFWLKYVYLLFLGQSKI